MTMFHGETSIMAIWQCNGKDWFFLLKCKTVYHFGPDWWRTSIISHLMKNEIFLINGSSNSVTESWKVRQFTLQPDEWTWLSKHTKKNKVTKKKIWLFWQHDWCMENKICVYETQISLHALAPNEQAFWERQMSFQFFISEHEDSHNYECLTGKTLLTNIYILSVFTEKPNSKPLECNVVYFRIITLSHAMLQF